MGVLHTSTTITMKQVALFLCVIISSAICATQGDFDNTEDAVERALSASSPIFKESSDTLDWLAPPQEIMNDAPNLKLVQQMPDEEPEKDAKPADDNDREPNESAEDSVPTQGAELVQRMAHEEPEKDTKRVDVLDDDLEEEMGPGTELMQDMEPAKNKFQLAIARYLVSPQIV